MNSDPSSTHPAGTGGLDLAAAYERLERTDPPGEHALRLDPIVNLAATVRNPEKAQGLRLIITQSFTWNPADIVGSRHIDFTCASDSNDRTILSLRLLDRELRPMFRQVCEDLVPRILDRDTESAAATTFIRRFAAWQSFLQKSGRGMSPSRQLGLFGELETFRNLVIPALGAAATPSWTGPTMEPQDFQFNGIAIEVKAIVHSEPQKLKISGERQLDDFGLDALLVAHHRVAKHQGSGETLPQIVDSVRRLLAQAGGAVDDFDDKLLAYGYADHDSPLYEALGYATKSTTYYRVKPGFPRIVETDLLPGIGGLSYLVDASACVPFAVDEESVTAWLEEPPRVDDPADTLESHQAEYKLTAWTPTGSFQNDQHRQSVTAGVKTAVVRTVVAFMNGAGGELVLGVEDESRTVAGIEPDLTSKGRDREDFDWYERELLEMLSNMIDRRAPSQVRVRFETHEGQATSCHVSVRPSPTPRFGRAFDGRGENTGATFWVRRGNATISLDGIEMLSYISEHWT